MTNKPKRFREYGFVPGLLPAGPKNSIADVRGVSVGHKTRIEGEDVRTGVTIVDPGIPDIFINKIPAAFVVGNGSGKVAGITQVEEFGTLEAPIGLTNTLAVGAVMRGIVDIVIDKTKDMPELATVNAVVGETNDGRVNAIHKDVITKADVREAYDARSADFAMGNVGAGTGTRAFAWKGGIGSASRRVVVDGKEYVVGALLQTNFGGALTIMGVPIGRILGKTDFDPFLPVANDGSCMIVLATDAPLSARQLKRIAQRSFIGLGRTGSILAHASGDYAVAFSTQRVGVEGAEGGMLLKDEDLNPFFLAAVETVEESVYDALFLAGTMAGRNGFTLEAIPVEQVVQILKDRSP